MAGRRLETKEKSETEQKDKCLSNNDQSCNM